MRKILPLLILLAGVAAAQNVIQVDTPPSGACSSSLLPLEWLIPSGPYYYCNGTPGVWAIYPNGGGTTAGVLSVTASSPLDSTGGQNPNISLPSPLPIANGGTGTATPNLTAGTNITITGTWPNQTIFASGGGAVATPIVLALACDGVTDDAPAINAATATYRSVSYTYKTLVHFLFPTGTTKICVIASPEGTVGIIFSCPTVV